MFAQVSAQFRDRAEMLLTGRFDELAQHYAFPLALYLGSSRWIVRTPEDAAAVFCLLRAAHLERGTVAIRPRIKSIDLPRGGRFRVWVDWHELTIPVEGMRVSSAIHYCTQTAVGFRTEMVNYTNPSMPEFGQHFAALALSA